MKKFVAPVVLFALACTLVMYLTKDLAGSGSSFDADAYLATRSKIDSLEIALWKAQGNPDAQVSIRSELDSMWEQLAGMRSGPVPVDEPQKTSEVVDSQQVSAKNLSPETKSWIVGGAFAVFFCIVVLIFILRRRQEIVTQRMEALKAERFREAQARGDTTLVPKVRTPKRSIIADAEEYAAKKKETAAQQSVEKPSVTTEQKKAEKPTTAEQKIAFEDENGMPDNQVMANIKNGKPTLRPTARQRITSAMQNLSDVLRSPRGLSRERTMRLRAQSRNVTGDPNLAGSSPLETSRFDRESLEKAKILQMSRRGFPASAIASQLKVPQDRVEAVIRDALN